MVEYARRQVEHPRNRDPAREVVAPVTSGDESRGYRDQGACAVADEPEKRRGTPARLRLELCNVRSRRPQLVAGAEVGRLVWSHRLAHRPP